MAVEQVLDLCSDVLNVLWQDEAETFLLFHDIICLVLVLVFHWH